ncbi:enoyl-CoA hydratase-related protein [Candidatus Frankia alpina]|uniref:enoyl-CoA hydratase-related protein n=1 Tax=Candidatus Frankia alpina TaxID=2699483 RepID=UPI0013D85306|nr:enoyl-CoA hydratase-related protein [Candidatus Frankia alpina]
MGYRCFEVDVPGWVAQIVPNRPAALNTLLPEFWREFPDAVGRLSDAGDVRALIISSTGRHFCAGMDLSLFEHSDLLPGGDPARANAGRKRLIARMQDAFTALERARMPVLAAVQGGCFGGGLDLITACDLRYATADAFFVVQETNIGIAADLGTLQRLPTLIPAGVARELAYTGRRLPATRAREVGLVNEVFDDHDALLAGVREIAAEIAERSPLAVWGSKESLLYARDHDVATGLDQIATWQTGAFQAEEVAEAMRGRAGGRVPDYPDLPAVLPL